MSVNGPVALGVRAQRGGAVAVALAGSDRGPRVALNGLLATAAAGDRLAFEPYHMAYAMPRDAQGEVTPLARAAVEEGRKRQAAEAVKNLDDLLGRLGDDGLRPTVAALLVNRAGWMTDLLEHALSAPEHPPVIEGLAVRDALRLAFAGRGLHVVELDEKSLAASASGRLGLSPAALEATLKELGAAAGRPWRKEQKLAALAAWVALAAP